MVYHTFPFEVIWSLWFRKGVCIFLLTFPWPLPWWLLSRSSGATCDPSWTPPPMVAYGSHPFAQIKWLNESSTRHGKCSGLREFGTQHLCSYIWIISMTFNSRHAETPSAAPGLFKMNYEIMVAILVEKCHRFSMIPLLSCWLVINFVPGTILEQEVEVQGKLCKTGGRSTWFALSGWCRMGLMGSSWLAGFPIAGECTKSDALLTAW